MLLRSLVLSIAATLVAGSSVSGAQAPAGKVDTLDGGIARLNESWQFHLGDDPAWAAPGLHDAAGQSGWQELPADRTLGAEAHPNYTGYVWYRRAIRVSPKSGPPKDIYLLLGQVTGAYEVYWNGTLVGSRGNLPPHPRWYSGELPTVFGLGSAREGVLAIRVWMTSQYFFSFHTAHLSAAPPVVGSRDSIMALQATADYRWLMANQYNFSLSLLYGLVLVISLMGWWGNRGQGLLLWMAAFSLGSLLIQVIREVWVPWPAFYAVNIAVLPANDVILWYLLLHLLGLRDDRRVARLTLILTVWFAVQLSTQPIIFQIDWTGSAFQFWYGLRIVLMRTDVVIAALYPLVLVALGLRMGLDPARFFLAIFAVLSKMMSLLPSGYGISWPRTTLFRINGSPFSAVTIANTLLLISVVYAVYKHQRESNRKQVRMDQEFRNARAVQQVLIPEEIPSVPGFSIQSVYKPAGEVGGDFFQILPTDRGGVLVVIGDVSGKGMPAAMTVSLLVGTVRTLARFTQSPGEILAAMNQRMLARSQGGFTTCLVVHSDADGEVTMANGGHLAPYLDGHEVEFENGLPLGLSANATYARDELSARFRHTAHLADRRCG
jgi:hypothetical protein